MANVNTVAEKGRTTRKDTPLLRRLTPHEERNGQVTRNGMFLENGVAAKRRRQERNGHLPVNGYSHSGSVNDERAHGKSDHEGKLPIKLARDVLAGVVAGAKMASPSSLSLISDPALLKPEQLVEYYDPEESANAIAQQLAKFAAGRKFLIFDDDTLNRNLSKTELQRLLQGFPDRPIAIYNELPYETFAVGKRPRRYTDQSPWDGSPLYNGESNAGVKWVRLPRQTRRLIFVASQLLGLPEMQKFSELELFRVMAKAETKRRGSSFVAATALFPAAFIQFKDLERQDHLPPLKIGVGAGA